MKILVAGIGNMFLGDDGFGSAVAERLRQTAWPEHVEVVDYGIRGMDLAFALTSGLDGAILVDAYARGGAPGTLYTIEPRLSAEQTAAADVQTHAMDPARVLALASTLGRLPSHVRLVGCEPATFGDDDGDVVVGLSEAVAAAVEPAVQMVRDLVAELEVACTS